ncbi:MAG: M23/M56 family metallopeptidase [Bacteroidota bacterium]
MITYFLAVQLCLFILWGIYYWGLRSLNHHGFNRVYLWFVPLLSLMIPMLEFELGSSQSFVFAESGVLEPPAENDSQASLDLDIAADLAAEQVILFSWILGLTYGTGLGWMLFKSLGPVLQLHNSLRSAKLFRAPNLYWQTEDGLSFAFGKRIYLGQAFAQLSAADQAIVIQHEQAHIHLKHRFDLYYFHALRAVFWFNPAVHLLLQSARRLHEYQADKQVIKAGYGFAAYAKLLLRLQTKQTDKLSFRFAFAEHPLTTRIKMLKTKTNWLQSSARYLVAIALLGSLITGVGYYCNSVGWIQIQFNPLNAEKPVQATKSRLAQQARPAIKVVQTQNSTDPDIPEVSPVNARVVSGYGIRTHPILKKETLHSGVDYLIPLGTPVRASARGEVILAKETEKYGKQILVQHANGYQTRYAHLGKILVDLGEYVQQGDVICLSGNTGMSKQPHLHFEILLDGKAIDPEPLLQH